MPYANMDEVEDAFKFHPPKDETVSKTHSLARENYIHLARWIFETIPNCHERDNSIDRLRESMNWANAGIAINQTNRGN